MVHYMAWWEYYNHPNNSVISTSQCQILPNIRPHFCSVASCCCCFQMFISIQKLKQLIWDKFVKCTLVMKISEQINMSWRLVFLIHLKTS